MSADPIRIVLADDHALIRAGIRSLLSSIEGMKVVAEAADGREALRLLEEHRPNVVLMDILMPEMNGLDATARVVAAHPEIKVLILSMNAQEEAVLQAMRAGASGYLLKDSGPEELEQAIKMDARGDVYLTPAVSKHVVTGLLQGQKTNSLERLTPRQREVLQLLAEGNSTKGMARKLKVSVKTIESHRAKLMVSLDIHDVPGLVRYAIRMGIVTPDK